LEFGVDVDDVGADGGEADAEAVGDFLVEKTLGQEAQDLVLAMREKAGEGRVGRRGLEGGDHLAGDGTGHGRATVVEFLDRFQQLGRGGFLEEIAGGSGFQGLKDAVVIFKDREHQNAGVGQQFPNALDALDSRHPRQSDVEQENVGSKSGQFREGGFSAGEGAQALESLCSRNQVGDGFPLGRTVLDQGHPNGRD